MHSRHRLLQPGPSGACICSIFSNHPLQHLCGPIFFIITKHSGHSQYFFSHNLQHSLMNFSSGCCPSSMSSFGHRIWKKPTIMLYLLICFTLSIVNIILFRQFGRYIIGAKHSMYSLYTMYYILSSCHIIYICTYIDFLQTV